MPPSYGFSGFAMALFNWKKLSIRSKNNRNASSILGEAPLIYGKDLGARRSLATLTILFNPVSRGRHPYFLFKILVERSLVIEPRLISDLDDGVMIIGWIGQ